MHTAGSTERYEPRLIRGKQIDYSLTKFSMIGYRCNLARSALLLYNAVVTRLDSAYLDLLHESVAGLIVYLSRKANYHV